MIPAIPFPWRCSAPVYWLCLSSVWCAVTATVPPAQPERILILKKLLITLIALAVLAAPIIIDSEATLAADKYVAITYDDGPGPYTAKLLDGLAARNAKATFFLVGNRVGSYADLVKREYNEGHQIASHGWDHPKMASLDAAAIRSQLDRTEAAIDTACGVDVGQLMLRPPYGSSNDTVKSTAGVPLILWSVDPLDWKYRNAETVKNNIVNATSDGAIILVHDIHPTSVEGSLNAIDILKAKGYAFVTVSELFRLKGITPVAGAVYTKAGASASAPVDPYDYDETKLEHHWAYPDIVFVRDSGLMGGMTKDKFGPEYPISRENFITVLCRFAGEDASSYVSAFADVTEKNPFYDAISWGSANGIMTGKNKEEFDPKGNITKEQAAVIMSRFLNHLGCEFEATADLGFTDINEISTEAKNAVAELTEIGIMSGNGDRFAPQAELNRAQTAALLHRVYRYECDLPVNAIKTVLANHSGIECAIKDK